METTAEINRVDIEIAPGSTGIFSMLSGYGFFIEAPSGISVNTLLQKKLGLDAGFIEKHIQTILHDGKPVDDIDGWKIKEDSTIALSGALPGLFGAAFRREGKFAALRPREMPAESGRDPENSAITITVKLFNLSAKELGPQLLKNGVRMSTETFRALWKNLLKLDSDKSLNVLLNGKKIDPHALAESVRPVNVLLSVIAH